MPNKINIYDICGTLYDSNTTMDFCRYRSKSNLTRIVLFLLSKRFFKLLNKLSIVAFSFDFIRVVNLKTLSGLTERELDDEAINFVNYFLKDREFNKVHNLLKSDVKDDVILVSATIEPVAKAISQHFGNIKYLATTLAYDNGKCLGKINKDLLGNKHKYFENKDIDLVVTDNKSDIDLCRKAKEIVIISKRKNIQFWNSQNIAISKIIKV